LRHPAGGPNYLNMGHLIEIELQKKVNEQAAG